MLKKTSIKMKSGKNCKRTKKKELISTKRIQKWMKSASSTGKLFGSSVTMNWFEFLLILLFKFFFKKNNKLEKKIEPSTGSIAPIFLFFKYTISKFNLKKKNYTIFG